ncbi:hypothetical protein KF7_0600 [Lactococcus lactis subsp. lactis]|nr:hypothetical protein KF7_0600 [Lactococcus lactis subsp. lactis]
MTITVRVAALVLAPAINRKTLAPEIEHHIKLFELDNVTPHEVLVYPDGKLG